MYNFRTLLKKIREEGALTQEELARAINVSTILVSMIETGQKEASKNFVVKLAERLEVRPSSIMPFILESDSNHAVSGVEKILIDAGEKLQEHLVKVKSKKLRQYVQG